MGSTVFENRAKAGAALAERLAGMALPDPVILALPRGGVPVARPIADRLGAPLDLLLVRKIGVPWQPELAAAAIVDGDKPDLVLNQEVMDLAGLHEDEIRTLAATELREIERRRAAYLGNREPVPVEGRTAIVVDDGIATGTTVRAALIAVRRRMPARMILAVPVAPAEIIDALRPLVDTLLCLSMPDGFTAIGNHYREFHQLRDEEVVRLLAAGDRHGGSRSGL